MYCFLVSLVPQEISLIPLTHHLGPLTLDCQPLKFALKTEAAAWKSHFSANIHAQAVADLQVGAAVGWWVQVGWMVVLRGC